VKNYIDKEEFLNELKDLKKTGELSEKLHVMFFNIASNYAQIKSFRNYTYIEDMVMEAYINCVVMAHKYDTTAGTSAFSYFTTVIHRNFLNFIMKEKRQQDRKWKTMRIVYETYKLENDIELNLTEDMLEKMYAEKI
jgi:DNA-directed RNA polymerase specialized sigma24 family protein